MIPVIQDHLFAFCAELEPLTGEQYFVAVCSVDAPGRCHELRSPASHPAAPFPHKRRTLNPKCAEMALHDGLQECGVHDIVHVHKESTQPEDIADLRGIAQKAIKCSS